MKILTIIMRVLLGLVLLMPVLGMLGVFPAPTADLYSPPGWAFMEAMMNTGYLPQLIGLLCAACLVLVLMNKTALAAVLLAPLTVNVMAFHIFVDQNVFMASSSLGWVLFITNVYFLWLHRAKYRTLW